MITSSLENSFVDRPEDNRRGNVNMHLLEQIEED